MRCSVWIASLWLVAVNSFPFKNQLNGTDPVLDTIVPWDLEAAREFLKRDVPANQQFCSGTDLQVYQEAYQDVLAAVRA